MTEPEPERIQFLHEHPMPTPEHATLLASQRLLRDVSRECLPVSVAPRGETTFFEDWEITRAAFMARMAGTLRHMSYLVPSHSRLDGFALARTLVDHVITFAWLSADPKDRLPAFLRDSFESLRRKDERSRSRGDGALLGDSERARLTAYTERVEQQMPDLRTRAMKAEADWRELAHSLPEELQIVDFKRMYHDVYDHYSAYDHPTTTGLQVFVHLAGDPVVATVDGEPERELVLAGGYALRRAAASPRVTLVGMGAVIPELLAAADVLGDEAEVICLTSADLVFRAVRARAGLGEHPDEILGELFPPDRAAPIVTVLDGDPHALAFLAAVNATPLTPLGVTRFGQSGELAEVYEDHEIDAETIVGAALDLLD